jgi:hypothetical protein
VGRKIVGGEVVELGTPHKVHEGEWVEILPVTSVGEYISFGKLFTGEASETEKEPKKITRKMLAAIGARTEDTFGQMIQAVSERVLDWNWTDLMGKKLPKPYQNPKVIRSLSIDELLWLANVAEYEPEIDRKKG